MAKLEYRKLSDEEIANELHARPDWALGEGQIYREVSFKTYKDGLVFAVAVGHLADKLDHHPDLHVGYAKVKISVNTHSVQGLSPYDFELARQVDALI